MRKFFLIIMAVAVTFSGIYLYKSDGVSIRISASDEDKRRLITAVKYYMPVEMLDTILTDDIKISYRESIPGGHGMCIAGYVRGNSVTLVDNADLVTILHEFIHVYDDKMKLSSTEEFLYLYEKYKDSIIFRFRTAEKDVEYVRDSNSEFFAECYAYYLSGDFSCDEMEDYFGSIAAKR